VSYTLTLGDGDEEKDGAEPFGLFLGEDAEGLGPVGLDWESIEVPSESKSSLHYPAHFPKFRKIKI